MQSIVLEKGKPIYHINRVIEETGESFGDGSHIIYVNGAYRDDTPLGKLMHDFSCSNPGNMNYKVLAEQTRYFKEDKEGLESMCKVVEDMINEEVWSSVFIYFFNMYYPANSIINCMVGCFYFL